METTATDVVVVGSGMAGLAAAVRATELDADVQVVEKGPRAGGSTYLSHGNVWTYETVEEVRDHAPDGNETIQTMLVEELSGCLDWLESVGADLKPLVSTLPRGQAIEPPEFVDHMTDRVEDAGGEVHLETPMVRLTTADDAIDGVVVRTPDGDRRRIRADAVVLATGGFGGNERLLETYVTEATSNMWLRANSWSTGDGLEAALDVGAKTTKGMSGFYGHNLAAPPATFSTTAFSEVTQYYGIQAIAVDAGGQRFTDESLSEHEERLTMATAKRADGRAYYLFDRDLYDTTIHTGRHVGNLVEAAREAGGRVGSAETLDDLAEVLTGWGVNGERAVETVREFNEAVRAGRPELLTPPRRDNVRTFDAPPFYAVEVQPGITFTVGGLDVDADMRVRSQYGTSSTIAQYPDRPANVLFDPIDGLYAAGVDVGNVHNPGYVGGLATALVTGKTAGESAAKDVS